MAVPTAAEQKRKGSPEPTSDDSPTEPAAAAPSSSLLKKRKKSRWGPEVDKIELPPPELAYPMPVPGLTSKFCECGRDLTGVSGSRHWGKKGSLVELAFVVYIANLIK